MDQWIGAVAFCPAAPWLIHGLAVVPASVEPFRRACLDVVGPFADVGRVVVISAGAPGGPADAIVHAPGSPVGTAGLGTSDLALPDRLRLPGDPVAAPREAATPDHPPGVGTVVAAHLLRAAGVRTPTWSVEVPADRPGSTGRAGRRSGTEAVTAVVGDRAGSGPVGLLALVDGSTAHLPSSPLGVLPGAEEVDGSMVAALATGDPAVLSAWVTGEGDRATAVGVPALGVLAAVAALVPAPMGGAVLAAGAPLGIGYVVARWTSSAGRTS